MKKKSTTTALNHTVTILFIFILLLSIGCINKPKTYSTSHSLPNLFSLSNTNLPLQMGICSGPAVIATKKLTKQEATHLLDNVLSTEGLTFKKDVTLSFDGVNITVNSYNEQYKTGYIWIDGKNRGNGMTSDGIPTPQNLKTSKKHLKKDIDYHYLSYRKDTAFYFKHHFESYKKVSLNFKKSLQENLPKYTNSSAQKAFFYKKYEAYYYAEWLQFHEKYQLSATVSIWQKALQSKVKDKPTALALLRGISNPLEKYFKSDSIKQILSTEIQAINNETSNPIWQKRSEALLELLNFNTQHTFQTNPAYQKILMDIIVNHPWQERKEYFYRLKRFIEINQISYKEAQLIDKANQNGKYFIALMSSLDSRLYYMPLKDYAKEEELYLYIEFAKNKTQKDSLITLLTTIQEVNDEQRIAKVKALKISKLIADFSTFIHQAKTQLTP